MRTNERRTCCFCVKTCAEHETLCTPCLARSSVYNPFTIVDNKGSLNYDRRTLPLTASTGLELHL